MSYYVGVLIVKGNNISEVDRQEFLSLAEGYEHVVLDLGTGDGRFVYENALRNSKSFYIGVDPSQKQLEIYSRKAVRKKLKNILYVIGSLEVFPEELIGTIDRLYIIFPWGSLLQSVVKPNSAAEIFKRILKPAGVLEIIFGYSHESEPSESARLDLPKVTEYLLMGSIVPKYEQKGFEIKLLTKYKDSQIEKIESSWGKRLSVAKRKNRPIFRIVLSAI